MNCYTSLYRVDYIFISLRYLPFPFKRFSLTPLAWAVLLMNDFHILRWIVVGHLYINYRIVILYLFWYNLFSLKHFIKVWLHIFPKYFKDWFIDGNSISSCVSTLNIFTIFAFLLWLAYREYNTLSSTVTHSKLSGLLFHLLKSLWSP